MWMAVRFEGDEESAKTLFSTSDPLRSRRVLSDRIRFEVSTNRTTQGCNWEELIFLQLETHPEARLGFARRPCLLGESIMSAIQHEAELHGHVTSNALDRLVHGISLPVTARMCLAKGYNASVIGNTGSFDSAGASLREASAPLRMTKFMRFDMRYMRFDREGR